MTVEKCDCNFSVKSQSNEFQNKIQWAFLKFSYIHEFETLFKIQKTGFSIDLCRYERRALACCVPSEWNSRHFTRRFSFSSSVSLYYCVVYSAIQPLEAAGVLNKNQLSVVSCRFVILTTRIYAPNTAPEIFRPLEPDLKVHV